MKLLFLILFILINLNAHGIHKIVYLKLNWKNQFQFAGYYMAKELGYYEDVDLDVRISEFSKGDNVFDAIKGGDAQFAVAHPSLLIEKSKGEDVVALGAIYQHSPMVLLTRDDKDIQGVESLKNRNIMISSDAKNSASIMAMLNAKGVRIDDINIQEQSFNLNDLVEGKTDAVASYLSNEPIVLESMHVKHKIFNPRDYGFDFYDDILFTSSLYIKNNPKLVRDFYEASLKGWKYAFDNITKSATVVYEKYNTQRKSLSTLIEEGRALKAYSIDNDLNSIGYLQKDRLAKIVDVYKVLGLVKKDFDLDSFIYEKNNYNVVEFSFKNDQILIYSIYLFVIVFIIVLIVLYIVVQKRWLFTNDVLEGAIKEKTQELKMESLLDALTKVKNRKAYDERLKELIDEYSRYQIAFCIISIDLDDFKKINDTFGHKKGDEVLIDFCRLAKSNIRSNDTLFRVGGEEFMVLLPNTNLDSGNEVCKKLLDCTQNSLIVDKNHRVTISMGLTEVEEGDNEQTIYQRVDKLLYNSKTNGKNQISCKDNINKN